VTAERGVRGPAHQLRGAREEGDELAHRGASLPLSLPG
jgi:hypothetical protein